MWFVRSMNKVIGIYPPVSITFVTFNMVTTTQNIINSNNIFIVITLCLYFTMYIL